MSLWTAISVVRKVLSGSAAIQECQPLPEKAEQRDESAPADASARRHGSARGIYWLLKDAEEGDESAQMSVGDMYYEGRGVRQD